MMETGSWTWKASACLLTLYMPYRLCTNIHQYAPPRIGSRPLPWTRRQYSSEGSMSSFKSIDNYSLIRKQVENLRR